MSPVRLLLDVISLIILIFVLLIVGIIVYFTFFSEESFETTLCVSQYTLARSLCGLYKVFGNFWTKKQGESCGVPWNCEGWWVFGRVECCCGVCVTKVLPWLPCLPCFLTPSPVSNTLQCQGGQKPCHRACIPRDEDCGEHCRENPAVCHRAPHHIYCNHDGDCGDGESCCLGNCVQKDSPRQTCDNYCSRNPGLCTREN